MAADRETRATKVGKWMLAVVVPASALALGSLLTPILIAVTLVAAVSCVLLWLDPPSRTSHASRWIVIGGAILLFATILQAIPLPAGLVSVVAPGNADAWARALAPLGEAGPSWHPISVAPPATHVEILRGTLYACVFLAALRCAVADGGTGFLERVVVASACAIALVSLAHASVHASRVYGIYRPHDEYAYPAGRLGPILNSNHLAAYLNVGAFVAAGLAFTARDVVSRSLAVACAVLLAGTSVWAGSRGGTAALVIGAVLFGAVALYKGAGKARGEIVIATGVMIASGVFLGLGASDLAREEMTNHDVSKLVLAKLALRLVPMSPVFGVGRGGFETMFPLVHQSKEYVTYLRVENLPAQWLVDWGVPVALAAAASFAAGLRPGLLLDAARPAIGAWVAVCAAVMHDVVDFHLEVPAVVVLVLVCIAMVVGSRAAPAERRPRRARERRRLPREIAFASAGLALVATALVLPNVGHSLAEDRDAVSATAVDGATSPDEFRRQIRAMMLRYPAEPFFPLAGAIHAQATGRESVLPWVGRALERYPSFGRAHLVLARSLRARNPAQARLEYRLAYASDLRVRDSVAREVPRLIDDRDSALEVVPEGVDGGDMLERLAAALGDRLPATAALLDAEALRRDPTAAGPRRRLVAAMLSDVENRHPWCGDRRACAQPGLDAARELVARAPDKCEPRILQAKLRIAVGEGRAALDDLSRATESTTDRGVCLRALVQLALAQGDRRRAEEALDRTLRGGCGSRDECLALYSWAAATEEARGNSVRAISFYKRAAEIAPEADEHLVRVAELADHAGLPSEASDAYGRLASRHPEKPEYRTRADELRAKAQERRMAFPP
jgi:hypothetical protein